MWIKGDLDLCSTDNPDEADGVVLGAEGATVALVALGAGWVGVDLGAE